MGSKTTTQNTTTAPDAGASDAYNAALSKASDAASTPFQAYSGEQVAPLNAQQNAGIGNINAATGAAQPDLAQAESYAGLGAATVNPQAYSGAALQQYMSPYQQSVINSTIAQIGNTDAQQQQQVVGNSISSGAFGGDRTGVAQAQLAGQQALANNSTLAGLNNQNFSQALGEFNTQQSTNLGAQQNNAARAGQAAFTYGSLGSEQQNTALTGANAQLAAGALQQGTQQAQDTAAYNQFQNERAYPFQTAQYLAGVDASLGPLLGGTSDTQGQGPSPWNSIVGGGLAVGSLALSDRRAKDDVEPVGKTFDGQTIYRFRYKGHPETHVGLIAQEVQKKHPAAVGNLGDLKGVDYLGATDAAAKKGHFASGGSVGSVPYGAPGSYVPMMQLGGGNQFQVASPNLAADQAAQAQSDQAGLANLTAGAKLFGNSSIGDKFSDWSQDSLGSLGSSLGFARGGNVRQHFDDGGSVDALTFDPNALLANDPNAFLPTSNVPVPVGRPADLGNVASPSTLPAAPPSTALPVVPPPPSAPPAALGDASSVVTSPDPQPAPAAAPADAANLGSISNNSRNNPGNLVDNSWTQSLPGYAGSDGHFAIFKDLDSGRGAMERNLMAYAKQGLDTPLSIVSKWAPRGDGANDPTAYAGSVARALGIGPNDHIDMSNPAARSALVTAMSRVENGSGGSAAPASLGSVSAYAPSSVGSGGLGAISSATANDNSQPLSMASGMGGLSGMPGSESGSTPTTGVGGLLGSARSYLHNDLGLPTLSDNAQTALLSAGLGMMASRSPWLGTAIGEGGMAGVKSYFDAQKNQRESANTASEIGYRKGELALGGRKQDLVEKQYNVLLDSLKAARDAGTSPVMAAPSQASTISPVSAVPPSITTPAAPTSAAAPGAPMAPGAPQGPVVPATGASQGPAVGQSPSIARNSDPAYLEAQAEREEAAARSAWMNPEVQKIHFQQAQNFRNVANSIRTTGLVTTPDGRTVVAPGFAAAKGSIAGTEASARVAAENSALTPAQKEAGAGKSVPQYKSTVSEAEGQGKILGDLPKTLDTNATNAHMQNNVLDEMAQASKTMDMGKFSNVKENWRETLQSIGKGLGIDVSSLDKPIASYQDFNKLSGNLVRNALSESGTQTRGGIQLANLFGKALPSGEISPLGFQTVASQLRGVNDFHIAKQQAGQSWADGHNQSYAGFQSDWNKNISPSVFVMRRVATEDPDGFKATAGNLAKTAAGRAALKDLTTQYTWAQRNGLFGQPQ